MKDLAIVMMIVVITGVVACIYMLITLFDMPLANITQFMVLASTFTVVLVSWMSIDCGKNAYDLWCL